MTDDMKLSNITSDSPSNDLIAALVKFQRECPSIIKSREGQLGNRRYFYADLAEIMGVIRPVLSECGLFLSQQLRNGGERVYLDTIAYHISGSSISTSMAVAIDGLEPREVGSRLTYARRYSIAALLGIVAEDDDDGKAAGKINGNGKEARFDAMEGAFNHVSVADVGFVAERVSASPADDAWAKAPLEKNALAKVPLRGTTGDQMGVWETRFFASVQTWCKAFSWLAANQNPGSIWNENQAVYNRLKSSRLAQADADYLDNLADHIRLLIRDGDLTEGPGG